MNLRAGADDNGRRLDRILRKALPDLPLSGIHRLLRKGRILVDGKAAGAEDRVAAGSIIAIPDSAAALPSSLPVQPRRPSPVLDILREEADLLFINKPPGLAVHGPASLNDAVQAYLANKIRRSLSFKPGPLHRLDKPTSGIIAFSKTLEGARFFSALIREGRIKKQYLAVVNGLVEGPAVWEDFLVRDQELRKTQPVGEMAGTSSPGTAKQARTRIRPLALYTGGLTRAGPEHCSLILAEIETGRTHQIRAQAAIHGFPLAGDKKYGGPYQPGGFLLHAWKLELPESGGEKRPRIITAPPPPDFCARVEELFPGYQSCIEQIR
jgi:23S rRNA pseudouridine955/2504/2580 synthase